MGKYLRRIVKKHSPTEVDFARINPTELSAVFCSAIKVKTKSIVKIDVNKTLPFKCYIISMYLFLFPKGHTSVTSGCIGKATK